MTPCRGSKQELADVLGIGERQITNLVKAGILPSRTPQGFDLLKSAAAYIRYLKSTPSTLQSERQRVTRLKADLLQLRLDEETALLVRREAVKQANFRTAREVRDRLYTIPSRNSGMLAAMTDQHAIYDALFQEITDALEGLTAEVS